MATAFRVVWLLIYNEPMRYYEVLLADGHYHGDAPLTYSSEESLPLLSVVSVPLRNRLITGFIVGETPMPTFQVKAIRALVSKKPLPHHCLDLASWMQSYYASSLGDALRQFAPSRATLKPTSLETSLKEHSEPIPQQPLTDDQTQAIKAISAQPSTTVLLHGETGSGKTRVYLELAKKSIDDGKSVILLTPEISLTTQLTQAAEAYLDTPIITLHSQLTVAKRRKLWLQMLESDKPLVVVGPRSALFAPLASLGLIVVDEAHEPAYKQEQSPRYHANRVASQLGLLTGAKVVLGTATPSVTDYYLAAERGVIIKMTSLAKGGKNRVKTDIVDLKDRTNFSNDSYLSDILIDAIKSTLSAKKQIILYLNRRGSARLILCNVCGWHFYCPNCDVPLTYHGDEHLARCHICGFHKAPPLACPKCSNPDIIYRTIGTKALSDIATRLFPQAKIGRFDSDSQSGERLHELYDDLLAGKLDILVGTQLLAKGLDLPNLGLVGVVNAEASLALPDYTAEERGFQLLYQIAGRVGRGHGDGVVIVQSYDPKNIVIRSAVARNWPEFYQHVLIERRQFKFPPFSYLLKLSCKRATDKGALTASNRLKKIILRQRLKIEVDGPTPSFYARRGKYHYYQLVVRAKDRKNLLKIAAQVPNDWQIDIDPVNLL